MYGHLKRLRKAEIEALKNWFRPDMRVLDIGGGCGYQASVIASWGCEVLSIDIPNRPVPQKQYYPVQDYDGQKIPFPDANFDIVFSSNVLEHIQPLPPIFMEIKRVLKPGGLVVSILPSSTWRFWTSMVYYIYLLKKYILRLEHLTPDKVNESSVRYKATRRRMAYIIKQVLFPGPHGKYPNALSELYYFSKGRWLRTFKQNGFEILNATGNGLFYTGYELFPSLSLQMRHNMASFIGSACHIFVMSSHYKGGIQDTPCEATACG